MTLFSNFRPLKPHSTEQRHDVPARSPKQTGKRIFDSPAKFHIQTVIFSRETRRRIFPAKHSSKPRKAKIQEDRKLFFSKKSQLFLIFFAGWASIGKFCGFGAVCRLADSVVLGSFVVSKSGLRRLSIGFADVGREFLHGSSCKRFLAGTRARDSRD